MLVDASVVADSSEGRVNEVDASAACKPAQEVGAQARKDTRHKLDKASVAHQRRKLASQMHCDMLCVVGFDES